jgi:hypothetical protein
MPIFGQTAFFYSDDCRGAVCRTHAGTDRHSIKMLYSVNDLYMVLLTTPINLYFPRHNRTFMNGPFSVKVNRILKLALLLLRAPIIKNKRRIIDILAIFQAVPAPARGRKNTVMWLRLWLISFGPGMMQSYKSVSDAEPRHFYTAWVKYFDAAPAAPAPCQNFSTSFGSATSENQLVLTALDPALQQVSRIRTLFGFQARNWYRSLP